VVGGEGLGGGGLEGRGLEGGRRWRVRRLEGLIYVYRLNIVDPKSKHR